MGPRSKPILGSSPFLTELCMHNKDDAVIFVEIYNGRIGDMADVGKNVDVDIANRTSIDRIKMRMVML